MKVTPKDLADRIWFALEAERTGAYRPEVQEGPLAVILDVWHRRGARKRAASLSISVDGVRVEHAAKGFPVGVVQAAAEGFRVGSRLSLRAEARQADALRFMPLPKEDRAQARVGERQFHYALARFPWFTRSKPTERDLRLMAPRGGYEFSYQVDSGRHERHLKVWGALAADRVCNVGGCTTYYYLAYPWPGLVLHRNSLYAPTALYAWSLANLAQEQGYAGLARWLSWDVK